MKVNQTNIRSLTRRYKDWLVDQQWFQFKVKNQSEWLMPLVKIIDKKANTPSLLWDAVIDHWQATNWDVDSFPSAFRNLYDLVDEYRCLHGTDGTDNINILIDELKIPENQCLSPQFVISSLYERLSGIELFRDTDPDNGEDYDYKRADYVAMSSLALHPEVCDYFGFRSKLLKVNGESLFIKDLKNWELSNILRNEKSIYTR